MPLPDDIPAEEPGFSVSGETDTFTAGDAVLDRAKSVSQQITDRVRELTGETKETPPIDETKEKKPLSD
jgi:hypothetical protein